MKAGIRRTVRADADQVPRLRHAVQAFVEAYCAGNNDLGSTVALAVTEACTNVVRHAYPAGDGEIELTASLAEGQIVIDIIDHGIGLQPASPHASPGLGVGTLIMRQIGDAHISSNEHGTRVELRFPCF